MAELRLLVLSTLTNIANLRLEGGAAEDEGRSSSGSLERFRRVGATTPRLAAAILGRRGELDNVSVVDVYKHRLQD